VQHCQVAKINRIELTIKIPRKKARIRHKEKERKKEKGRKKAETERKRQRERKIKSWTHARHG
jgi:hypothetical protein